MNKFWHKAGAVAGRILRNRATWYLLGLGTPLLVFALVLLVLYFAGWEPPLDAANLLVSRWDLLEEDKGRSLLVHLPTREKVCFIVGVKVDKGGLLEEIGVTNAKSEVCAFRNKSKSRPCPSEQTKMVETRAGEVLFPCFVFRAKGRYGVPMAVYGAPDNATGVVWQDLNADGLFDLKIDYENQLKEIWLENTWREAAGTDEMVTKFGVFRFNAQSGKWQIVDPNAALSR